MPYNENDLGIINSVLRFYPEVNELVSTVKHISEKAKYPINSLYELINVLGGEDQGVLHQQGGVSIGGILRPAIPAYYFPIASDDDLIAKLMELREQASARQETHYQGSSEEGIQPMRPSLRRAPSVPIGPPPNPGPERQQ